MAEHGLFEAAKSGSGSGRGGYDFVEVDMARAEHKRGGRYSSPNQKLPMVVLPDGVTFIAESVAICRYVEESAQLQPPREDGRKTDAAPTPMLFGEGPTQRAVVEMWQRRVELELLQGAVGKAWVHGPVLKSLRERRGLEGHESELQLGLAAAQALYRELDRELATRAYVAGDAFSIADITLLCVMDFAAGPVRVPTRWTELPHLTEWHRRISARPSALAHPNPHITVAKPAGDGGGSTLAAVQERYYATPFKGNRVWRPNKSNSKL